MSSNRSISPAKRMENTIRSTTGLPVICKEIAHNPETDERIIKCAYVKPNGNVVESFDVMRPQTNGGATVHLSDSAFERSD